MKKIVTGLFVLSLTALAQAEDLIPAGAKNIATTSGAKTTTSANMHTYNSLFNGTRDRWLGYKPKPETEYYPSETVTFTEARPLVNAYRVWRGNANSADRKQSRQATQWELYGSNDGGETLTLLHAQTESVTWYDGSGAQLIDYFDCAFENTVPYSTYKFRVVANGGATDYVSIDDVGLYCLERTDTLTIEHNGFELGEPTPAYGGLSGLKEGDTVTLSMVETRIVDPVTSRRYELTGFTVKNPDGEILHEGTTEELPYEYVHGTRGATVVWNWSDLTAEFAARHRDDLTVAENANSNEISDGRLDGATMTYIATGSGPGTRAGYGPQFLFDKDDTSSVDKSRWDPFGKTPYFAQYIFKENGVETARYVTGIGLRACNPATRERCLYGFDFEGSNDGVSWTKLLSVTRAAAIVSGSWDFSSPVAFSRYRFVVTKASGTLEMYNLEFYNYRGDDVLEILGSPAYGQPEPDYGVVEGLSAGEQLTLTAPSTEVVVSEGEKSVCSGYVLSTEGTAPVTNLTTTCHYTHSGKGATIMWLFASAYRHQVSVRGSGSVDCAADSFLAGGTELTITATPESDDEPFLEWQGDVPEGQESNPVLTFTVDKPRSLTAVFAAPVYVSLAGDDANGGMSREKAVRTVARGWEVCGGAGKMYLGEGEFEVKPGVLNVTHSFQLTGEGADKSVLLADNSEANGTLLTVDHERAVVSGVRVKGASLSSGLGAGLILKAGTVTNCWLDSCATSGNGGGAWLNGTGLLVDSVFTNCTASSSAGGAYVSAGTFLHNLVTGCSAKSCGGAYFMSATTVADSAFIGNTASGDGGAVGCNAVSILFTNCVFEANTARGHSGIIDYCPGGVAFDCCLFTNNVSKQRCGVGMHFSGKIRHSRLIGNSGSKADYGGLLCLENEAKLENSLVTENIGGEGTLLVTGGSAVRNCTIVSNRCASAGAIRCQSSAVRNSIVAGNYSVQSGVVSNWTDSAAAVCCCIPGHDPDVLGTGSIAADPLFADAANGDWTLAYKSPCVNAGSNSYVGSGEVDLVGNPRIHRFGGRAKHDVVDMGCYESPWRHMNGLRILVR